MERFVTYKTFIFVGLIMIFGVLIKLLNLYEFSSDWFWLLAGLGLIVEGTISLIKQKKFDNKYRVVEKQD